MDVPDLLSLSESLQSLKEWFNGNKDRLRLLVLVSPT